MYIEFVISYILIGVLAVLVAVVIILQCIILKKMSRGGTCSNETSYTPYSKGNAYTGGSRSTAICRNCATQFDGAHTICPKCGTPR